MFYAAFVTLFGLAAAMEVSNEPVAYVVDYGAMEDISLTPQDVLVFSFDLPQVKTVENSQVTYAKRSMAEMMAANVPVEPPESKPTLPNESRKKKRLDHTPPFTGTVTGDVSIIKSAVNQRIILVSNIQGDGLMQVLVRGNTAKKADGAAAKAVMNTPLVIVRNSKEATDVVVQGAASKKLDEVAPAVQTSLTSHFKGQVPDNLRIVEQTITVD